MTWTEIHAEIFADPRMIKLKTWIKEERKTKIIAPAPDQVMNAFKLTPYDSVRVVILGQDPYPDRKHAHGLAFSSLSPTTPKSLQNIFKEINDSVFPGQDPKELFKTNNLTKWAEQGVLLINTVLTVEEGKIGSHLGRGWEVFTEHILKSLNKIDRRVIFLLWGNKAKEWKHLLTNPKHHIFEAAHPSPMSADKGFFGCNHFPIVNQVLRTDYFDIRPFITYEKLVPALISYGKENNVTFDSELIKRMNLGCFLTDIPNKSKEIDWKT